jgi:hypothetical protein
MVMLVGEPGIGKTALCERLFTLVGPGASEVARIVPFHSDERLALMEECSAWPREGVSSTALGSILWYSAKALRAQGERARAENLWRQKPV